MAVGLRVRILVVRFSTLVAQSANSSKLLGGALRAVAVLGAIQVLNAVGVLRTVALLGLLQAVRLLRSVRLLRTVCCLRTVALLSAVSLLSSVALLSAISLLSSVGRLGSITFLSTVGLLLHSVSTLGAIGTAPAHAVGLAHRGSIAVPAARNAVAVGLATTESSKVLVATAAVRARSGVARAVTILHSAVFLLRMLVVLLDRFLNLIELPQQVLWLSL